MAIIKRGMHEITAEHEYKLPKIKTKEEQIVEIRKIISEDTWLINKEWALAQFDENPDVEFEKWGVAHFYNYIFKRTAEVYDISYGNYYFLILKGTMPPEIIINGEKW